ncbi:diguanylate cyclase [Rhodoplanes sp. TEM]|uniref:diguanylate cyclase n=1 Tax=Rhodoplanes tepidamans TaxID=200616 RepID=A0ABT5JIA9_RHOTP|nr:MULTISPECIES: diguanylate cyclase [Rhodoplanes]MDC7789332.1 diguanylate cyclase [Rhodoplanes tepidamans]MDC7986021.1 diguanylate cyclase [Rhodoplanes sp. TEM]MDQ0358989.1 diguanylate cyclase (GGDEF)-like protein [Rhodoplanes tepidamans]
MRRDITALLRTLRTRLRASLQMRLLLVTLAVFVAVSLPAYVAFEWIVRSTVVKLGTLFAEKQVLFDRYRGLEALMREVSLAETLTRSPAVTEWAADEASPEKRVRGLAELERYRQSFQDHSYFFVVHASGNYYFNDRDGSYTGDQLRYTVSRDNPRDGWYFTTLGEGPGCRLNVDRDDNLAVTKVWINCVIAADGRMLGVIGTGVDLTAFIREVVDIPQVGVQSMFVDRAGAIQAHRDPRMVDFHSLTKDTKAKKTIYALIDREDERAALAAVLRRLADGQEGAESRFIRIGGADYLVGVGYLDRVGWFNVTLMDIDAIIDRSMFAPIAALLALIAAAAVALMMLFFRRVVLDRLAKLEVAIRRMEAGDFAASVDRGRDEIGRLSRAFARMAARVGDHTGKLEAAVAERTVQLRRLAHVDPLTGIYNRRGVLAALDERRAAAARDGVPLGLLLIDFDLFKTINDAHGHHGGDRVLSEAANRLRAVLRPGDVYGRWGGDEFIVVAREPSEAALQRLGEMLLVAIGGTPVAVDDGAAVRVSISVGGCRLAVGEPLDAALARADAALYSAKHAGRDTVVVHGPGRRDDGMPLTA